MSRSACVALLGLVSVLCAPRAALAEPPHAAPAAAAPSAAQKLEAQKAFGDAGRQYDAGRFAEALETFRASYRAVASPNTRLMIARCLRDLGRDVEAYEEFGAVIVDAKEKGERYESAAQAAADEQGEVAKRLAFVTVRLAVAREGTTVRAGDRELAASSLGAKMPFAPGNTVFSARAPDGTEARVEVALTAGSTREVVLELAQPVQAAAPPPAPVEQQPARVEVEPSGVPLRTWALVAGGVGVVGLGTFGVFGAMSSAKYSDLEDSCPDRQCPPGARGDIDTGKTYQTIANVGLAVGVLGLGAGATLFLLDRGGDGDAKGASLGVRVGAGSVSFERRW